MKTGSSTCKNQLAACMLVMLSLLCCNTILAAGGQDAFKGFHDSSSIKISQYTKSNRVKLYPDLSNEVIFFSAKGEEGKAFQLFLFDMDGKLVRQTQVVNSETTLLTKFEKGNYLFEVFSNDDRIQNGSIVIK